MATRHIGDSATRMNCNAPPFVPGQHEHASYMLYSTLPPQPWGYGSMPHPYYYHNPAQYPYSSYNPGYGPYSADGYNSYYSYNYPPATAPWYPPNVNYVQPMHPYADQSRLVQDVHWDGERRRYSGNHHDRRQNSEGDGTYAGGNAKTHRPYKKKGKKGKKGKKNNQERRKSEEEKAEEGKPEQGKAEQGKAEEREEEGKNEAH